MKRVFCLGNGESRKNINLERLRPHGKIYGCNALYRDFTPDVLVSVDHGIMHEIYHSGYCEKNETWFRDWSTCPGHMYEHLVYAGINKEDIEELNQWHFKSENERTDQTEFVMHGANLRGMVTLLKKNKERLKKQIHKNCLTVSWVRDTDKTHNLKDIFPKKKDFGWAAGPSAGYIACTNEQPDEVYLIGHDLNSTTSKVNNMYKGTKHYVVPEHGPTPSKNWIRQWLRIFTDFSHIKFYKVNENMNQEDNVNNYIKEWKDKGVEYITQDTFKKSLDKWSNL